MWISVEVDKICTGIETTEIANYQYTPEVAHDIPATLLIVLKQTGREVYYKGWLATSVFNRLHHNMKGE